MGVKQLWTLLAPVGRPVLLETMEGKVLAIDSSIWLYQFQATMRDKDGRGLVNAHILGFLRRICKLLFYGIRPVFVFDGGAPALKRSTLNERRKKKSGAAASHVKLAEKLLAAQLRKEALNHATAASTTHRHRFGKTSQPQPEMEDEEDDGAVYMEDLEADISPRTPAKQPSSATRENAAENVPSSSSAKKADANAKRVKWQDHDPYKLPEVDMNAMLAKATSSDFPDARMATEDELRAFIEDMRPEDFDITSETFRELPTEVQYEIIGDLRLKSRQTSHKRLQAMLKQSSTPLDFSKAQIKNLKQRNNLTQQLLTTTDIIGKAHITIPVRIASERNREYMLVKNEGADGGWVLGIRDEGTEAKPIEVDAKSDGEESDESMDMVTHTQDKSRRKQDPDLREYQQQMALSAIARRSTPKKAASVIKPIKRSKVSQPLFVQGDEDIDNAVTARGGSSEESDPEVMVAIQQSLEMQEEANLQRAFQESQTFTDERVVRAIASSSRPLGLGKVRTAEPISRDDIDEGSDEMEEVVYSASAPVSKAHVPAAASISSGDEGAPIGRIAAASMLFGLPTLLMDDERDDFRASDLPANRVASIAADLSSDEDMEEVLLAPLSSKERFTFTTTDPKPSDSPGSAIPLSSTDQGPSDSAQYVDSDSEEFEEVVKPINIGTSVMAKPAVIAETVKALGNNALAPPVTSVTAVLNPQATTTTPQVSLPKVSAGFKSKVDASPDYPSFEIPHESPQQAIRAVDQYLLENNIADQGLTNYGLPSSSLSEIDSKSLDIVADALGFHGFEDEVASGWSRSPSPSTEMLPLVGETNIRTEPRVDADFDAADEMDPEAEEGDFAKFISQVKGKDLDAARDEIDEEIRALHREKKAAMRDSEDVTQQMTGQIKVMLKLFGIPYLTAPMEAEAQCATLVQLGLVEGIITDDSDVFLFGGLRVYRNMFNQSKTVECFLLSDLSRELGLDRDRLIRIAYLLGSDYVDGLPGVGPVVAMELLKDFDGEDGLVAFREWWTKVQSGRDKPEDNKSKFRQRFKKKFKDLYLGSDWPNPLVKDAYYHPTVDDSNESFKWGLPDLDALREFLKEELGWSAGKVDETLLPIVHKVGQRGQADAATRQSNLNGFLDISAASGTAAPRQRHAYASKRLQKVVSDFRKRRGTSQAVDEDSDAAMSSEATSSKKPVKGAKSGKATQKGTSKKGKQASKKAPAKKKRKVMQSDEEEWNSGQEDVGVGENEEALPQQTSTSAVSLRPRPKPRRKGQASRQEEGSKSAAIASDSDGSEFFMRSNAATGRQ